MSDLIVLLLIFFVLLVLLIKGVIRTFQRAPVVAALFLIFLGPVYILWAIFEIFIGGPEKSQKAGDNNGQG